MITIINNGKEIVETNYWESDHAKSGLFYLSWNASALRVLVPENKTSMIPEMLTGKMCIVSRGILDGRDCLELMFEDYSDSPFSLHIGMNMCDRAIVDDGKPFVVAIWTKEGKKGEMEGKYRVVKKLPCLDAWK